MIIFMVIKLVNFSYDTPIVRPGIVSEDGREIIDISPRAPRGLAEVFGWHDRFAKLKVIAADTNLVRVPLDKSKLHAPIPNDMPVWAAGVTYKRSVKARNNESIAGGGSSSAEPTAYDLVYPLKARPELFQKANPGKSVGNGDMVGIRRDAKWSVPEPEMVLVFNSLGERVGYTIGNDMSSRDIEGENLLYLPQAKTYSKSCALGPAVVVRNDGAGVADDEQEIKRNSTISMQIIRNGQPIDFGDHPMTTTFGKMRRPIEALREPLFRCQDYDTGVALLTGTGIVPPDDFTLQEGDKVRITISGIGTLENIVTVV
jgi:2-dehydro-3-deoxy-D-arabinonate dehydratase